VIAPKQILTGAHVVANATFLQVQKVLDPDKCTARVIATCHDTDLALLEVADEGFLSDVEPQVIGELPSLRDPVSVVGYPVGGDEISVTEGVVSRIELQRYRQSRRFFLAVTVDAAINDGNSGGPAFKDGKVIGIAFQTLKDAENIGELVPSTLIRSFLDNATRQPTMTMPALGAKVQALDNASLRRHLGLGETRGGVLVTAVHYGGSACGNLQPGDVILEVESHHIASNGTVQYQERLRTGFAVLFGDRLVGDVLKMRVQRAGKLLDVELTLQPSTPLVPRWKYDEGPSYLVYGGLVFQQLTLDFLATWHDWWENAPPEFLHYLYSGTRTEERQEIVVLGNVLADAVNVGYERLKNESILSVQGVVPRTLNHFAQLLRSATGSIEIRTSRDGVIVFDPSNIEEANARVAERYRVHPACSDDLL
jgi:S1-C subfamily serine protease